MAQPRFRLSASLELLLALSLASACNSEVPKLPGSGSDCQDDACEDASSPATGDDDSDDSSESTVRDATVKPPNKDGGTTAEPSDGGKTNETVDLGCTGQQLVDKYCSACHGEKPIGAPMSLTMSAHYQAAAQDGRKMHVVAKDRLNATGETKPMPPAGYPKPSAAELEKLNTWLEQGAPAAKTTCTKPPEPTTDGGSAPEGDPDYVPPTDAELECFKIVAHNGDLKSQFMVGSAADAYFNFTFAAPWKSLAYGISFKPIIDNEKVIHHWLLFQDDVPGVPNSITPSVGAHPVGQLLAGWAPGGETLDFRASKVDVGLELPGDGTTYTMEYHYNSSDPGAKDASGVEVCVMRKKPKNIAGLSWLGYDQLLLPAAKWTGTCTPLAQEPIHILAVTPHMHVQGKHMKGIINRKDGTKETLHDEAFDFEFQRSYIKDVKLMPGDTITTECTFNRPMSFGTQTNAEMCYLFTMAYPKGALRGLDLWGTFAHGGSSCLGQ
jgi:cytochrome c5